MFNIKNTDLKLSSYIDWGLFKSEFFKIIFVIFLGFILGLTISKPILGIFIALFLYLMFFLIIALRFEKALSSLDFKDLPYDGKLFSSISDEINHIQKVQGILHNNLIKQIQSQKNMLDTWPDGMVVIDNNNVIQQFNINAANWLGLQKDDKGKYINNIIRNQRFIKLLKNKTSSTTRVVNSIDKTEIIKNENVKITSPANQFQTLTTEIMIFIDNLYLLIIRDVTYSENIERMRKDFLANISHELKTPLTSIKGFTEILYEDLEGDSKTYISHVKEQANRMNNIINDILNLSRLESSHIPNYENKVDIASLIVQEVKIFTELYPKHQINCNVDNNVFLLGDETELKSIVTNLIANAINHNDSEIEILIKWSKTDNGAVLVVADNGMGIEAKEIPNVTERFYRVDSSRAYNSGKVGTGLGLAIVKHVVIRHNGELRIKSSLNKGFYVQCSFLQDRIFIDNSNHY